MLIPFTGKRGSDPGSGIVKEEPKGIYWSKRDAAMAKKSNP